MSPLSAFERLLVAVLIGILIGLDRERAEVRKAHRLFAGVRTFPLIALAGAVPMLLTDIVGPAVLVASFLAVASIIAVSYWRGSAAGDIGATTEIAALATFLVGALAGAGQLNVAAGTGIAVAVLLVAKPRLEGFSRALSEEELAAVLELAVISVIILPLAPNRGFGPWQVLNPFEIWLVVVLVSGLSFAGFVAVRFLGQNRGIIAAGALGALVSSTAVTVSMATQVRTNREVAAAAAAAAAVLASTIMCVRVAVLAGAVNADVLPRLVPVVLAMLLTAAVATWILVRHSARSDARPAGAAIANPFSLASALTFGVIYALVVLGARAAREYFGAGGLYAAAALSSLADVDAAAIAITRMGPTMGDWRVPATAIAVGMVSNTVVKIAIAIVMGAGRFRWYVAGALAVMAVAGTVTAIGVARF